MAGLSLGAVGQAGVSGRLGPSGTVRVRKAIHRDTPGQMGVGGWVGEWDGSGLKVRVCRCSGKRYLQSGSLDVAFMIFILLCFSNECVF